MTINLTIRNITLIITYIFKIKILLQTFIFFFFNDTATTEIYTLSLHDALPIYGSHPQRNVQQQGGDLCLRHGRERDRKSTRLNSSHSQISYAVFCLKKKKTSGHRPRTARVLPHAPFTSPC